MKQRREMEAKLLKSTEPNTKSNPKSSESTQRQYNIKLNKIVIENNMSPKVIRRNTIGSTADQ